MIAVASLLNCIPSLALSATEGYGNQTLPVTYWILDLIRGSLYLFVVIVITYYAGVLVWKDRDERMDEIADSMPTPEWMSYASRLLTLMIMVMLMQTAALLGGIAVQTWHGYHRYQMGLYLHELLVRDASAFLFLSVLAFLIHVLSPNKYIGYFFYIAFLAGNSVCMAPTERSHQPGPVRRQAKHSPLRHVWRRSFPNRMELVQPLLDFLLRPACDFNRDVLAPGQTRPLVGKTPQRRPALPRRLDLRITFVPARFRLHRRMDLVQH